MARKIKNVSLDSRTARAKLSARGKPYFAPVEPGLHLGYRKPKTGSGKWIVRFYAGAQAYEAAVIAVADDFSDPDGDAILSFDQAVKLARSRMVSRAQAAAGTGPFTVADAMEHHFQALEVEGRNTTDARKRATAMILPDLGAIEVANLTTARLNAWLASLVNSPPRVRTRKGKPQQYRKGSSEDPQAPRRRRSTAKRIGGMLWPALNRAFRDGRVATDKAWRNVETFKKTSASRARYLTIAEAQRLINACAPDFRDMVRGALLTGARYGELCRARVADFNSDSGTLHIPISKSGKPRDVVLTDEGQVFFRQLCAGRAGDDVLLRKSSGKPWGPAHQIKSMVRACERAGIRPAIAFHGLRHSWASHAVMNKMPLMVVAKNLGHRDIKMVEEFYGHLAPDWIANEVRAAAPKFGFEPDDKVALIGRG